MGVASTIRVRRRTPVLRKLLPSALGPNHGAAMDRLRAEQLNALARRSPILAAGSIAAFSILALVVRNIAPDGYLTIILLVLIILHGIAVLSSRAWLRSPRTEASPRMLVIRVIFSGVIAATWGTVPVVLMPAAGVEQRELLIYVVSGLMAAGMLLAPLRAAALCFLGIITGAALLAVTGTQQTIDLPHMLLITMFGLMMAGAVASQAEEFAARVMSEMALEEQHEIVGLLLRDFEESANDWMWETDSSYRLDRVSERMAQVFGCRQVDLQGSALTDWPQHGASGSADAQTADKLVACLTGRLPFRELKLEVAVAGRTRWLSLTGKPIFSADGAFRGFRGVGSDITAAHHSATEIARLAHFDALTGLPNRTSFHDLLRSVCARSDRVALLSLDLDGFKLVNDSLGHGTGDALLIATARRLRGCLNPGDMVARLGGDEFAVLHVGADLDSATALAERIIAKIDEPYQLGGMPVSVSVSVGVALTDGSQIGPDDLLKNSDLALYHSKGQGRHSWHFFNAEMASRAQAQNTMQVDLRHALDHGGLSLEFQPILDLSTGMVIGAEALARWNHPEHGAIPPSDFIPIAESCGMIGVLGAWVLQRACQEAARWQGNARVAVNLSPLQFRGNDLLKLVDDTLRETGLDPSRLELEITESVFLKATDATTACLYALKDRGIHIALDDFGTGYSSLSYLRSFPFDKVKIDRSFISDLNASKEAMSLVQSIIEMASNLGMNTTAEGVETAMQAQMLRATGCTEVQGFWYGRPCSPDAISELMGRRSRSSWAHVALATPEAIRGR